LPLQAGLNSLNQVIQEVPPGFLKTQLSNADQLQILSLKERVEKHYYLAMDSYREVNDSGN